MDFLKKYDFTDADIENINKNNSSSIIKNIVLNRNNVCDIIDYLIELGISVETIKKIFTYQISLFHKMKKELIEAFEEYEIKSIINSLNFDVNTFDLIEF